MHKPLLALAYLATSPLLSRQSTATPRLTLRSWQNSKTPKPSREKHRHPPPQKKMSSPSYVADDPSDVECNAEFRAFNDDAWYSVRVILEGEVLRFKYHGFSDEDDSVFDVKGFKSLEQLSEFKGRLRHLSDQFQDNECDTIVEGMTVCASFPFGDNDVRFYDANIDAVKRQKHTFENGEEECVCTFILFWLHGPNAGSITTTRVDNICKVRHAMELDPSVASFVKMARKRIEVTSTDASLISKGVTRWEVETQCAEWCDTNICPSEGPEKIISCHRRLEDSDLGAKERPHVILIGNLDKVLSPPEIAEFLLDQTSVLPRVYIYPNMPWETYTAAVILLDSKYDFEKLNAFLSDPNCIIMTSRGRPWVVIKEVVRFEGIKAAIGTLPPLFKNVYQKESSRKSKNLKAVYSGTEDFEKASRLREMFVEFTDHQIRLHGRLAFEESLVH